MLGVASTLGALLAIAGPAGPALAATGDSVVATANGTVAIMNGDECDSTIPDATAPNVDVVDGSCSGSGSFNGLALAGEFSSGDGAVFVGVVCANPITFSTRQTVLRGIGTINPGTFNDTIAGTGCIGGVSDICQSPGCFAGAINGGNFARVGTVAVALFDLSWTTGGLLGGDGDVDAAFVGTATPPAQSQPSIVNGVVLGGTDNGDTSTPANLNNPLVFAEEEL